MLMKRIVLSILVILMSASVSFAETVWHDADGLTYAETLTFHKACPKRAFNISYSGDGDPTSVDVEFDLMQDAAGKVLTVVKADKTA